LPLTPQNQSKLVKDVMNNVVCLESITSASDAAKLMEIKDTKAIIVIENNKTVGIITDRDYTIKIGSHSYPIDTPIHRLMSSPLISIDSHSSVSTAVDLMNEKKIKKLTVTHNEKITGIVYMTDLIKSD
jgi:CBS domain-containing protein